ncbi:MAG: methyltransferase domain-containing protein [Proteobacteria bacterium]|nr:methyltransferase domain-containing protein [Pseudomonadota bacterium]
MNDEEFRLVEQIDSDHCWFVGKRHILKALLEPLGSPDRVLDLGCGTGGALRSLSQARLCVGADRSSLALRISADRGVRPLVRADLAALPFSADSFDVVLLLDVIEHLPDDVGFLREARLLCARGGRMIVAVPAFQVLWSQHDETFQHYRRYSARQLRRVIEAAGLVPERITYTFFSTFPVALLWRVASYRLGLGRFAPATDFFGLPAWLNRFLIGLFRLEARLLARTDLPLGSSVVCIARRD